MTNTVLIVGASGIVGSAAAARFAAEGWRVAGLARRPVAQEGVEPVAADLQDRGSLEAALEDLAPTHLVLATWQRRDTEAEMIRVNGGMVETLLDVLRPQGSLRHAALVTGLKHYLGPFEAYGKGALPQTPFREDQGACRSRISTTLRKMPCLPPPSGTASRGASTARTPSSARRWAMP